MEHDETTVVAFTAPDLSEAEIVKSLLIANGLRAMIENESAISMMDGMVSGNLGVNVLVPSSELVKAKEVIAVARRVGGVTDAEAEEE